MPLHFVRNDLSCMDVDAVVVPANAQLRIEGGAGEAVARIAGIEQLQQACDEIGGCSVGDAVVTPAFNFPAQVIVHAVGPLWKGGQSGEDRALYASVSASLEAAVHKKAKSIALPLISAGSFGFPPHEALAIETAAIRDFLESHEAEVWLVLYDRQAFAVGRGLFADIDEYIDDVYVSEQGKRHRRSREMTAAALSLPEMEDGWSAALEGCEDTEDLVHETLYEGAPSSSLADRLNQLEESFASMVLRLIDERHMTDVEVYKRANMSRQLFSKIRKDDGYRPTKRTACALAFALKLDLDDAMELLQRAGFALSHSSKFDIIIEYFLLKGAYDVFTINETLFAYGQPLLG